MAVIENEIVNEEINSHHSVQSIQSTIIDNNNIYKNIINNLKDDEENILINENEANKKAKMYYLILIYLISASFSLGVLSNILKYSDLSSERTTNILNIIQTILCTLIIFIIDHVIDKKAAVILLNGIKNCYPHIINEFTTKYTTMDTSNIISDIDNLKTFTNAINSVFSIIDSSILNDKVNLIKQNRNRQLHEQVNVNVNLPY